jgi:hypothetical protein
MDNYTQARQKGYNAYWSADTSGCPYDLGKNNEGETLRYAWFQGYYKAEHDIATGNY